jgi:hypothetical protein
MMQRAAAEERGITQSLLLRLRAEAAAAKDRLAREKAAHIANAAPAVQVTRVTHHLLFN